MEKRGIAQLSMDAIVLRDRLRATADGDVVAYAELSSLVGADVQGRMRGSLNSARRIVERENQIRFDVIRGTGLRRMSDVENVSRTVEMGRQRIHSAAKRAFQGINALHDGYEALPNESKIKFNTGAAFTGAIAQMTRVDGVRRIEARVRKAGNSGGPLSLGGTLDAFKG